MNQRSTTTDWKDKYLSAVELQEKRDKQHKLLTSLLVKAVVRLSMVAEGVDTRLDKQLAGVRSLFRDSGPSGHELTTLVQALDGQVKRLEVVKDERAKVVSSAFQSLIRQLETFEPERAERKQLKLLAKSLASRSQSIPSYSALVNEYADLQNKILKQLQQARISKPFWHRWAESENPVPIDGEASADPTEEALVEVEQALDTPGEDSPDFALDIPEIELAEPKPSDDEKGKEPPFSKLNEAVCEILNELLEQIESPDSAKENYRTAKRLIDRGLNWYELVPTLENIALVVMSAFDSNQRDFEGFLGNLNQRLEQAYEALSQSNELHSQGAQRQRDLDSTMREQFSAMQDSVNAATELEQLKTAVSGKIDQLFLVMDNHKNAEGAYQESLSQQLDALVARVKEMETASAEAEQKIEHQRQKALRDVLTQLPNREAYQQRLEQEYQRWQRYQRPLSMVVCDIDHFKKINDSYGHLAGDKVLRIVSKTLQQRLRQTDFIARYGGEEFVLLLPETSETEALSVAEGLRKAFDSCPFHFKEQRVSITLSFGISEFSGEDKTEAVFERCDQALYQAKDAGRNRCVVAGK